MYTLVLLPKLNFKVKLKYGSYKLSMYGFITSLLIRLNWNVYKICVLSVCKIPVKFVLIMFNSLLFMQQDVCVCESFYLILTVCIIMPCNCTTF